MQARDAWRYLLLLLLLLCGSLILGSLTSTAYLWFASGTLIHSMNEISQSLNLGELRVFIGINQFFSFLVPGILGLFIIPIKRSSLLSAHPWWIFLFFIAWYILSLPLFQWLFYINLNLAVPQWWPFQIDAIPPFLIDLISEMSIGGLIANLLVIAVLPALGEELIFRVLGIRLAEKIIGSGHLAVLATALCFSIVHFDFQGLLPRFFLGIILGYSFLLTRNFWVPFIIHFIHNGSQLFIAYFSPSTVENINQNIESPHPVWVIFSAITLIGGYLFIHKYRSID